VGTSGKIKVAIAEQHLHFREASKKVLSMEPDLEVVCESSSGLGLAELVETAGAGLLLLDEKLMDGLEAETLKSVIRRCPGLKVILLMNLADERRTLEAFRQGVHGVLEKGTSSYGLPYAIRKVADGEVWISRSMTSRLIREFAEQRQMLEFIFR
jgi:DNA-binding NarL/FixJ family response regulator